METSFLGQIELFAFNFAPKGWETCKGQIMQIGDYQAVYSLMGS